MSAGDPGQTLVLTEIQTMRIGKLLTIMLLAINTASADETKYLMNFDLKFNTHDGQTTYSHQMLGINFLAGKPFHGKDLGEIDYYLTVTDTNDGKGKLTIEFYQYETRKKQSDVLAELVEDVVFDFGSPVTFESENEAFGVNLAFSVVPR